MEKIKLHSQTFIGVRVREGEGRSGCLNKRVNIKLTYATFLQYGQTMELPYRPRSVQSSHRLHLVIKQEVLRGGIDFQRACCYNWRTEVERADRVDCRGHFVIKKTCSC